MEGENRWEWHRPQWQHNQAHPQDTEGELLDTFPPNWFSLAPNAVPGCYLPKPHPVWKMCGN